MKNTVNKIILAASTCFLFSACSLDEVNPSAGDASIQSFTAWSGLQAYCYSTLNDELYTSSDWMFVSEVGTDIWLPKSNGTGTKELFAYESLVTSTNNVQKLFKQCNAMITNCNTVINEAKNLVDGDPKVIDVLVAETKTLRAFYLSILVANFGPVTLNLESSSSLTGNVDLYPKRTSEKAIYEQIFDDYKDAIVGLGKDPYQSNRARVTKKAAKGLLARAYAQRAGLGKKYGDAEKYWKLAAETAEDLILNASDYGAYLYTDIADMWADANNRTNKEALFISAGPDASKPAWQYAAKNNKLSAYSAGGHYSDFFNANHAPGDKGYFYGRLNSTTWMPSKYLMYCFNPEWDRRWEYSFQYAWCEWTGVKGNLGKYTEGQKRLTQAIIDKYGITKTLLPNDSIIYPYVDCELIATANGAGNQTPANIWPKGDHSGNTAKLLKVAPSAALMNTAGYAGTTKAFAVPYPVALDDDRFNTVFVHEPLADKSKCIYPVVVLRDLYDSNEYPYGNVANGSEAANPVNIGNGKTTSFACPSFIKFNWSYNGVFVGSNQQIKTGDMFIMRMAEVYLLAAEANERLGDGPKAAGFINALRKRSVREGAPESQWKIASATEDDVLDEYARELCGEFTRWALLKRHNAFETRLAKYNGRAAKSFKPYHYNRPIPFDFLSTILNMEEFGDNGYGSTATSGLQGIE